MPDHTKKKKTVSSVLVSVTCKLWIVTFSIIYGLQTGLQLVFEQNRAVARTLVMFCSPVSELQGRKHLEEHTTLISESVAMTLFECCLHGCYTCFGSVVLSR